MMSNDPNPTRLHGAVARCPMLTRHVYTSSHPSWACRVAKYTLRGAVGGAIILSKLNREVNRKW